MTARPKRRGEWTNPDITSVEVEWFDYLPEKHVQVTSYEVKKRDSYSLSSVYEASAHQRMAHKTFLVIEVGDQEETVEPEVEAEAARLGVGIMKAYPKGVVGQLELETVLEPAMRYPTPSDLDEFIEDFFEDDKDGLRKYKHAIGR